MTNEEIYKYLEEIDDMLYNVIKNIDSVVDKRVLSRAKQIINDVSWRYEEDTPEKEIKNKEEFIHTLHNGVGLTKNI
ncbi:hypothetical protein PCV68_001022 [Staphylococcus pseudintermedius]|nr:hypothetical protein [Staphylococcus pseudintermedius]